MTKITLSPQQQAVIDWALRERGSLNLVARAGCGKTFTLIELVKAVTSAFPSAEMFLGAYNKSIAEELGARLEQLGIKWKQAQASTLHSAGFAAWRRVSPDVQINAYKVRDIIKDLKTECVQKAVGSEARLAAALRGKAADCDTFGKFAEGIVSLAKQRAFGFLSPISDAAAWRDLVEHFGSDDDLPEDADVETGIRLAMYVYKRSVALDHEVIDYDDMITAPLIHNARMWPKDWVLLDEAQDTNPARRALAMKMLKPHTGRMVVVGDPAQAIYGFTGADSNSMDLIQQQLGSKVLPLNVTRRCPKQVVDFAQQWVPDFKAHAEAPAGLVRSLPLLASEDGGADLFSQDLTADDVIICRNTKPLVELAFHLLKRGVACQVTGKDVAAGLIKLAQRWKVQTLDKLEERLSAYKEREVQKFQTKGLGEKAAAVEDKVETLMCVIAKLKSDGVNEPSVLVQQLFDMFGDGTTSKKLLQLMTGHRSKGLEWDRVFILGMNAYQPSKWATKTWQVEQETNLMYVMATRAKAELVLVEV